MRERTESAVRLDADSGCSVAPGPAQGRVNGEEPSGEKGRGSLVSHHSLVRDWGRIEPGSTTWFARSALGYHHCCFPQAGCNVRG